ncbi:hypothetical protein THAOC_14058, partial [Thalassiosira oceanica]
MDFIRSSSCSISGNLIQNCADKAIALFTLTGVTVENNTLMDCKWGLWNDDATSLAIRDMNQDGIELSNAASSSIIGNSIHNCGDPAISLFDSADVTFEDNTLVNSKWGMWGINANSLAI